MLKLSFGDWDENEQRVNDKAISNNKDREKVLATVAEIVFDFIQYYLYAIVYAKGFTPSRTRLYQMGIAAHWAEVERLLDIMGLEMEHGSHLRMAKIMKPL